MRLFAVTLLMFIQFLAVSAWGQTYSVKGKITEITSGESVPFLTVVLKNTKYHANTDINGNYEIKHISPGDYILVASSIAYKESSKEIKVVDKDLEVNLSLSENISVVDTVSIISNDDKSFGITRLRDVEGTAIYAGKKTEVIVMKDVVANTATNNSRQIYSKIAGLNIWENDGAGIQLGIGGRGLNPNRVSNFNTRQNGYDMSADALGYPESYYSPATEALDKIEIVRGAASLQYGTQFGGMVNFKMKRGPEDKKIEWTSRQTGGSWGFFNTFNSLGGTVKKVNYYTFYQHKSGNGWRPNSQFSVDNAYAAADYKVNSKITISLQYTYMHYLAHQAGGLTDKMYNANPRQSIRDRNWFKVNWNMGAAILDYQITDNLRFNTRFFGLMANRSALGILGFINRADPLTDRDLWVDQYRNFGNESRLLYYYKIRKIESTMLVGFRYYSGYTDRRQGLGNSASTGTKSDFQFMNPDELEYSQYSFPNHNTSLFAENIFYLNRKLSIIPGIRFENILTRANGFYNLFNKDLAGNIIFSQRIDEQRRNKRSFVIGGLGVSYKQNEAMQLYANISQNYRSINFNDMRVVNPNLKVDPNLKDETGYSADMGMRGVVSNYFSYDLSLFMINYNNRIGSVLRVDSATFNTYRLRTNISRSRNIGIETFAELDIWRLIKKENVKMKIAVFSNLSLLNARYISSKEAAFENKKVELVPSAIVKTGITFKKGKFGATYQYSYTSSQFTDATNALSTNDAVNGLIPSYYVMDVSAQYAFKKYITMYLSLNNITNNMYFTRRADSYPGPGIIPSDGRSIYLTLQFKL